ncbi:lectin protein kinase family protein, partial [Prunus dulcis]
MRGWGDVVSQIDEDEVAQISEDVDVTFQLIQQLVQRRKDEQSVEISNEVDKYFADPFESPLSKQFNLLNWWKGNQTRYLILSQVAKDIFAIPSSTIGSENAFNLGKRIVDPFRSSLHPKMVHALVCTCDWLRADEFSFYKEPMDDEIELYKEMEHVTT